MIDVVAEFGRRLNIPVAKKLNLDGDFIVLLDYYEASKTHNSGISPGFLQMAQSFGESVKLPMM